jgi:hypothetical protein
MHRLGDREEEFQEETTTGTTPYAPNSVAKRLHKVAHEQFLFSRYPIPILVVRPTCIGQPCLSHSRSAVHERHTHLQILKLALLI